MPKISSYWSFRKGKIVFNMLTLINTFSENDKHTLKQYSKSCRLRDKGLSVRSIAEILNLPRSTIRNWLLKNITPAIVKAISIARENGWLPINHDSQKFTVLLEVFSWIFGDGHLGHKDGWRIYLSGQKTDLEKLNNKILKLNLDSSLTADPGPDKKVTETYRLVILGKNKQVFGRILLGLGAPANSKVRSEFTLPEWVQYLDNNLKRRFLEVFLSNEITVRKAEKDKWLSRLDVRMNKLETESKNLIYFMNQIRTLLKDFDIESSEARIQKLFEDRQGKKCIVILSISKSIINTFKFSHTFELIYAKKKQDRLNAIKMLCRTKVIEHIENVEAFKLFLEIRNRGLNTRQLSQILNTNFWKVDNWVRRSKTPKFYHKYNELQALFG